MLHSESLLRAEKSGAGRVLVTMIPNDTGGVTVWGILAKVELLIKS